MKNSDGTYTGEADDVIGTAKGISSGNALNWSYVLDLKIGDDKTTKVTFDDWMFLQPGGVLINRARMSKFGIEIGQITISFMKRSNGAAQLKSMIQQSGDANNVIALR